MKKRDQANLDAASLDELVEEITVDANGEDEQLWAFRQAFEDNVSVPCEATVIGEPVKVMKFVMTETIDAGSLRCAAGRMAQTT
jgi:hypothetical protein